MNKIFVRFLIMVGVVYFCSILFAQYNESEKNKSMPTLMIASPCQVDEEALRKAEESKILDSLLLESEPVEIKQLLLSYIEKNSIDIDLIPKYDEKPINQNITLFGQTIHTSRGIDKSLIDKLEKRTKKRKTAHENFVICIMQFVRPLSYREIIELCDLGVKFYEPLGIIAVVARIPLYNVNKISQLPFVKWLGDYKKEYKYSKVQSSQKPEVFLYIFGTKKPEYEQILKTMGIQLLSYNPVVRAFIVKADNKQFSEIADLWWIRRIERNPEVSTFSLNFQPDDSRQVICAFKGSFNGSGVNVGIYDMAVWPDHPDLSGVFISGSDYGTLSQAHGTHTTSTILGRGTRNIEGQYDAKGVSPSSRILFRSFDYDYSTALAYFCNHNIKVSNHSWGFSSNIYTYDSRAEDFDFHADLFDMLHVISAGNDGPGSGTIRNPALSKNCLAVGAMEYVTSNLLYPLGRVTPYSSRGPTSIGRLKPDLIAPGGDETFFQGVVAGNINPNGISTGFEWPSDDYYTRMSGTSMASPHVTGVLANMLQWQPSATSNSLKTGIIINTIPVKYDNDANRPMGGYATTTAGFGLLNGFSPTNYYSNEESDNLVYSTSSLSWSPSQPYNDYTIYVPPGTKKLLACLAYNDFKGDDIQNDLDLALINPSGTAYWYYSYRPSNTYTESPLEKMVVENPVSGNWKIRVRFYSHAAGAPTSQVYTIQGKLIYKTPALGISNIQSTYYATANQEISLSPRVENIGGYIAAGVNLTINAPSSFSGDVNETRYVDNLMYQGDSKTLNSTDYPPFVIRTPSSDGTYNLSITAKAINLDVPDVTFPFTVVVQTPSITVTSPNGSEYWMRGTSQNIRWNSSGVSGNVKIELYKGGSFYGTITSSISNSGSYLWYIPTSLTPGNDYKIKITSVADPSIYDYSDNNFNIYRQIVVTSPNGGEVWYVGETRNITWTTAGIGGNVDIYYSTNGGSSWNNVILNVSDNGSYPWQIPNTPTTQGKVRVRHVQVSSNYDQSDDNFAIYNPTPTLTGVSPNNGNRLQTLNVTLTGTNFISGVSSVDFGSGITVNSTTVNSSTSITANITISASASTGARNVSVTNATPGGGTATLTNGFTVNNPAPTLTGISPNNGNRLQTLNVTLTGTNFISGVSSVDFGSGITVNSTTVNSSTSITANITISASASTGARNV
ncbi:MAG: S8 family serine peptidase, partial [candidate division WOR-3 bacterium]